MPRECLIRRISNSKNEGEASDVVQEILKVAENPSDATSAYCSKISECDPEMLSRLVMAIELSSSDCAETEWDEMRKDAIEGLRLPSSLVEQSSEILNELMGWIIDISMKAWGTGEAAIITSQSFANAVEAVKERRKKQRERESPPDQVPIAPEDLAGIVKALFVEQLKLVELGDEILEEAINDFIRYGKEVMRLTETGEFTPDDWEEFERELQSRWKRIFDRIQRLHGEEDEQRRGVRSFHETTTDFMARLKGEPTDHTYFTAGAYHRLADELEVGWHPRFVELLTGKWKK